MKLQVYLELSEKSLKLCGVSFRIAWKTEEPRSPHRFIEFFEVRNALRREREWKEIMNRARAKIGKGQDK